MIQSLIRKLIYNCSSKKNAIKISYGITVCNESDELKKLLKCLTDNIDSNDEIIILSDKANVTEPVLDIISDFASRNEYIKHISFPLNSDFSRFKNNLITESCGDYLFQIDADEIPNISLLKKIKEFLYIHNNCDCFRIPRINIVNGISEEYIKEWNWKIDDKNRINYPDLQMRLFKLNKNIIWVNKVHEVLINYDKVKNLPHRETEQYCLYHIKEIQKQVRQNDFYNTISE